MLVVESLEVASNNENKSFVQSHLGCSQPYHQDGINALNAAFANGGVFIKVKKGAVLNDPIVIHHVSDCKSGLRFSQPRILASIEESAEATLIETYHKIGNHESLTNEVIEICVEKEARFRYIKLQNEGKGSNHTGTTQIQQLGKSFTHAVTITLDGGVVRNNLNMIMKAEFGECHLYGLYLLNEDTQADNHTIVDNAVPNCYSNELYKGIMDGKSSGTFNGKIFVRKDAQKTNAYQSNKNILIGDHASANTKPHLEIFADDVKCSHGCTIGKLDEDALFYLRARGISEKNAQAMLLHAFALDIVLQVEIEELKNHIDQLISDRLLFNS
jgi:Fe-S cluster assembly protein SufD